MSDGMDIPDRADFRNSGFRGHPPHKVLQRGRHVGERGGDLFPLARASLEGDDRFSADPLDLTAAQTHRALVSSSRLFGG